MTSYGLANIHNIFTFIKLITSSSRVHVKLSYRIVSYSRLTIQAMHCATVQRVDEIKVHGRTAKSIGTLLHGLAFNVRCKSMLRADRHTVHSMPSKSRQLQRIARVDIYRVVSQSSYAFYDANIRTT